MLNLMSQGGPLMWLNSIERNHRGRRFPEKLFNYHRAQINTTDFINGVRNSLDRGNFIEAVATCDETRDRCRPWSKPVS